MHAPKRDCAYTYASEPNIYVTQYVQIHENDKIILPAEHGSLHTLCKFDERQGCMRWMSHPDARKEME